MNLLMTGLRRRKKEWRAVLIVTLIASFFMAGVLMFQNILQAYVREWDKTHYGDWFCASDSPDLSHPYLTDTGHLASAAVLLDDQDAPTGIVVGAVFDDLLAFGRIRLYEGRFPQSADEAAVDLNTLAQLGYSYELGQTLILRWNAAAADEEPDIRERAVTLTGTVSPFASVWHAGYRTYPHILVAPDSLSDYSAQPENTWFYRLDPSLSDIDTASLDAAVHDAAMAKSAAYLSNVYLYGQSLWGSISFSRTVWYLMIVLAVFAVSHVLAACTDRRRAGYYRLRLIGVSRVRLSGIIAAECALASIPAAAAGIGLAYLAGFLVCRAAAARLGLHGFFAFDGTVFARQVLFVCGAIAVSILLTLLRCRDKNLSAQTQTLGPKELARLRRRPRSAHPERELFSRVRAAHAPSRRISVLFTIASVSFLLLCSVYILRAVRTDVSVRDTADYEISFMDQIYVEWSNESGSGQGYIGAYSPYCGPSDEDLDYLRNLTGVDDVTGERWNTWYLLDWDQIEQSPSLNAWQPYMQAGVISVDRKGLKTLLRTIGGSLEQDDIDAFLEGKQFILIPRLMHFSDSEDPELPAGEYTARTDPTLADGKMLTLFSNNNPEGVTLPMKVVYDTRTNEEASLDTGNEMMLWAAMTVLIPPQMSEQLRVMEGPGTEFRDNILSFRFNPAASFEATDRLLAAYAAERGANYRNLAEGKRIRTQTEVLQPLLFYGSLFLMTIFIYLIIQKNFIEVRIRDSLESCRRARQCGMTAADLSRLLLISEARVSAVILAAFPAGLAVIGLMYHRLGAASFEEGAFFLSCFTHQPSRNMLLYAVENVLFHSDIGWLAVLTVLLYAGMTVFAYAAASRQLKKEALL